MNLESFFNPKSLAIVGATDVAGKVGQVITKNILGLGYKGQVFLVNQKYDTLFGKKCYRELSQIEESVQMAIVAVPAKAVNQLIRENGEKIKNWVVISAGFSETGSEGKAREEELRKLAEEKKLKILGPNCLGFIIPRIRLNASFSSGIPRRGGVSFVTQSGALAVAIMDSSQEQNIRFSNIVSVGNKMEIDEYQLLGYLIRDKATKAIGMYLEGIKSGQEFLTEAKSSKKPIVILKAGKSERAQRAISSHTGSLAGDDLVMDAVFREAGIIRAKDIEEFLGFLKIASKIQAPKNEKVVVITNAGGLGVLTTDAFQGKMMEPSEISAETKTKLSAFLPEESSLANPVDLLGDADEERYSKTLEILEGESADTILCLLTPQDQTPVEKIAEKIVAFKERSKKKVVAVFMGGKRVAKGIKILNRKNVPTYFLADQAVLALNEYYAWSLELGQRLRDKKEMEKVSRKPEASEIIQKTKSAAKKVLSFSEAKKVMDRYSIKTVNSLEFSGSLDGKNFHYPVVVKVDSEKVLHKTDQGGIKLDIKNQEDLEKAISEMSLKFPGEKIIIEEMIQEGVELLLGMKRDRVFGPVLVLGLGGIYTEIFKMVDLILPKIRPESFEKIIMESRIGFLFKGARGQSPYNLREMTEILANFSQLVLANPEISEIDINPLMIYNDGSEASAVDVKILL